jgi:spore maturation protein CgeB
MYRILATAKIVVNRHGTIAEGQANNMRLYEATGSGALLLTDAGRGLGELFDVGREVVAWENRDDLVEKARHFLANDDERVAVATAGQQRTLREHTYVQRMAELEALLQARLGSASSASHDSYASAIAPAS